VMTRLMSCLFDSMDICWQWLAPDRTENDPFVSIFFFLVF
jgi:hypothetical protein